MASLTNLTDYWTKTQVTSQITSAVNTSVQNTLNTVQQSLNQKQNIIGNNDLTISMTNGLQDAINAKQNVLPASNAVTIQQVTNLGPNLDAKANVSDVYNRTQIDSQLAGKQPIIKDKDLSMSMINGLEQVLNSKQGNIVDGSLSISKTANLQQALVGKCDNVNTYSIAQVDKKVSDLNDIVDNQIGKKADISAVLDKNEVLNQLSTKQNVIHDNDLLISNIRSLQSILDSKQSVLPDHNAIKIQQVENLQNWLNAMAYKENVYYINEIDNMLSQNNQRYMITA
jgi:hypothetical protein